MHYRIYFTGPDGGIRRANSIECDSDAEAIETLRDVDRGGCGAEIWQAARKLPAAFPYPSPPPRGPGSPASP